MRLASPMAPLRGAGIDVYLSVPHYSGASPSRVNFEPHTQFCTSHPVRGDDAYSDDADHQFRQADHRFRSMPITLEERRSIAALGGRVTGLKFRGWSGSPSSAGVLSGVLRGQPRAGFPEG